MAPFLLVTVLLLLRSEFTLQYVGDVRNSAGLKFCTEYDERMKNFRVIGGSPVPSTDYPFYGLLFSFDHSHYGEMCGATVLNERWLLTAAHCIPSGVKRAYVRLGVSSPEKSLITLEVHQIVKHAGFQWFGVKDDIALVQTRHTIPLGVDVQQVCVPLVDRDLVRSENGTVIGFGVVVDKESFAHRIIDGNPSQVLRESTVPLINTKLCSSEWFSMSGGINRVSDDQLCAGSLFHGTAPGDSGGPLLVVDKFGNSVQVGITSYGASGVQGLIDQDTFPGVYTRVSSYIPWIEAMIEQSNGSLRLSNLQSILIVLLYLLKHYGC